MNGRRSLLMAAMAAVLLGGLSAARAADQVSLTIGKLLELTGPLSETGPSQDKAVKHRDRLRQPVRRRRRCSR